MATPKQIAANRRNAQKSCGAKSEAGKAIVSQNRTIHGLTGTFQVMPCERQEDYDDLLDQLVKDEKPVGLAEAQWWSRWRNTLGWPSAPCACRKIASSWNPRMPH